MTDPDNLVEVCQGMDAILCSIGARAGWRPPCCNIDTPKHVDYQGVKNLAEAAAFAGVFSLGAFVVVELIGFGSFVITCSAVRHSLRRCCTSAVDS